MIKYRNNTNTRGNLENALSGEAVAHMKYIIWGDMAEDMGYPHIARCYRDAANHELSHGRKWMCELGMLGSMNEGLQNTVMEEELTTANYVNYASDAENEGFDNLKTEFLATAEAEKQHMNRFSHIHQQLTSEEMFVSSDCNTVWKCYNCGYSEEGIAPPQNCPLCGRPETWFSSET